MIALSDNEVSIEAVESAVAHPDCGADLLFVGRVRGVYKGQQVHHLEYEAYPEMAIRRMTEIAAQAFVQFEVGWPSYIGLARCSQMKLVW